MLICSKCSTQLDEGSLFCHICGARVQTEAICIECGHTIRPGAKFCGKCGAPYVEPLSSYEDPQYSSSQDDYLKDTDICPKCGAVVGITDVACYACGYRLDGYQEPKSALQDFLNELAQAEELEEIANAGKSSWTIAAKGSPAFERKITLIKTAPLPDDPDELLELAVIAASSIDNMYGLKSYESCVGRKGSNVYTHATLANAWLKKLEMVYQRAKIRYSFDPVFQQIKSVYVKKMRELKRPTNL